MKAFAMLAAFAAVTPCLSQASTTEDRFFTFNTMPGRGGVGIFGTPHGGLIYTTYEAGNTPYENILDEHSTVLFDFGPNIGKALPDYAHITQYSGTASFERGRFVARSDLAATSVFSVHTLDVVLEQTLEDVMRDGVRVGSALSQTYHMTNRGSATTDVALTRSVFAMPHEANGTTRFGRTVENGTEMLFAQAGNERVPNVPPAVFGITALGGTIPTDNRFEVNGSDVFSTDLNGPVLTDRVYGDTDGDQVVVSEQGDPADLMLRNVFSLAPGETDTYFTQTLFGEASPAAPGSREVLPILPDAITVDGGFVFDLDPDDLIPGETIFFDPEIAIGYTYEVTGAAFDSVTAPSVAAVADPDGYTLNFTLDGTLFSVALAFGETVRFGDVAGPDFDLDLLTMFTISGIDPNLGLDPDSPTAFVTGASFRAITGPVTLTQTAISTETAAVPLPAPMLLLGSGLLALGAAAGWRRT